MSRRPLVPAALCAVALVGGSVPAGASTSSRHLWATINVCDTIAHPNAIGIRGSMPGSGNARESMFMRFGVQYQGSDGTWHDITKGGSTAFTPVGSGRAKARQAGEVFIFAPPPGGRWFMRGVVVFEWRIGKRVEHRARQLTTAGHRSSAGADPDGYSSDTCVIS